MTKGGMITDEMRTTLYQAARDMLLSGKKFNNFKTTTMEGLVTTENKYTSLGYIAGIICEADFETEFSEPKRTVQFIMTKPFASDEMLEQSEWKPIEDIFKDHPSSNAHLN